MNNVEWDLSGNNWIEEEEYEHDPMFEFFDERNMNLTLTRFKQTFNSNSVDFDTGIKTLDFAQTMQPDSMPMMKFNELISVIGQLSISKDILFVNIDHFAQSTQEGFQVTSLSSNFGHSIGFSIIYKDFLVNITIYDDFEVYMLVCVFRHVKDHIFEDVGDRLELECKNQLKQIFEVLKNN